MPGFDDLILTVTPRIAHEEDFAFAKNKGELANLVRSDYVPKICELCGMQEAMVWIDDEGDIIVGSGLSTAYITRNAVILSAGGFTLSSLRSESVQSEISSLLEELFKARAPMRAISYEARFFIPIRFKGVAPWAELEPIYSGAKTSTIAGHVPPSRAQEFAWSFAYKDGDFRDSWELKSESRDFQVRYSRGAQADRFPGFRPFLAAADLPHAIECVRPIIEPLIADPERLRGRPFLEPAQR